MRKSDAREIGSQGETIATDYLMKKGYRIVQRNFRTKWGEIDIVARCTVTSSGVTEEYRVFVEVKTKRGDGYGAPWEMVGGWKTSQVRRMGEIWCREYGWTGLCRLDVISVVLGHNGDVEKIEHWENVS